MKGLGERKPNMGHVKRKRARDHFFEDCRENIPLKLKDVNIYECTCLHQIASHVVHASGPP